MTFVRLWLLLFAVGLVLATTAVASSCPPSVPGAWSLASWRPLGSLRPLANCPVGQGIDPGSVEVNAQLPLHVAPAPSSLEARARFHLEASVKR